ncbi:hypothetical protein OIO90_003787 [Microbotryomycetes sp. JL221]|nr:hypothetical protein OIO90_003787 [Microbotryomycetes sp. JL221]
MAVNLTYFDNAEVDKIEYSTGWSSYDKLNQSSEGVSRYKGTLHWCRAGFIDGVRQCTATVTFTGSNIAAFGDYQPKQSKFWCFILEGEGQAGIADFAQGQPWRWFDASMMKSIRAGNSNMNRTRCAVSGLSNGKHRLVIGQDRESSGEYGITLDYLTVNRSLPAGGVQVWSSDFVSTTPQTGWEYTLRVPETNNGSSTPVSTSTSDSSASASAQPNSEGGSSSVALGVGLGVGLTVALCAIVFVSWILRRRSRRASSFTGSDEKSRFAPSEFDGMTMRSGPMVSTYDRSYSSGGASPQAFSAPELHQEQMTPDNYPTPTLSSPSHALSSSMRLDSPETFSARGGH